jgi:hypothetical protein
MILLVVCIAGFSGASPWLILFGILALLMESIQAAIAHILSTSRNYVDPSLRRMFGSNMAMAAGFCLVSYLCGEIVGSVWA